MDEIKVFNDNQLCEIKALDIDYDKVIIIKVQKNIEDIDVNMIEQIHNIIMETFPFNLVLTIVDGIDIDIQDKEEVIKYLQDKS